MTMLNVTPPAHVPAVLIVEDDATLRALLVEVVSETGVTVEAVETADAGLLAFEQHPEVDLILTDVVTPGDISGWELASAVHKRRPTLPVIVTSGYNSRINLDLPPCTSFLPKPWSLDQICSLVKSRLESSQTVVI